LPDHHGREVANPGFQVTDHARRITRAIIGYRHRERRPTFVTSNLTVNDIYYQFGAALADRIEELCIIQPVGGVNLRDWQREQRRKEAERQQR
jgi:DNA replication protein DnaC